MARGQEVRGRVLGRTEEVDAEVRRSAEAHARQGLPIGQHADRFVQGPHALGDDLFAADIDPVVLRDGRQRDVHAEPQPFRDRFRQVGRNNGTREKHRQLSARLPNVEIDEAQAGQRDRKVEGPFVHHAHQERSDPARRRLDHPGAALTAQDAQAFVGVTEHPQVRASSLRKGALEGRRIDLVVGEPVGLLQQEAPACRVHHLLDVNRAEEVERFAASRGNQLVVLRFHMGEDVAATATLLQLHSDLAEGQAVDPDLAAEQHRAGLFWFDADHIARRAVDRVRAEKGVPVLLVQRQLEGLGDHLLGFQLRQGEPPGARESHAVDEERRLDPVALARSVDELPQLQRDVEARPESRRLEVQGEQAVSRVIVEVALLRRPILLPACDDLFDAKVAAPCHVDRFVGPLAALATADRQHRVLRVGVAVLRRGLAGRVDRARGQAAPVQGVVTCQLEAIRAVRGHREAPRTLPRAAGLDEKRDVRRAAVHEDTRNERIALGGQGDGHLGDPAAGESRAQRGRQDADRPTEQGRLLGRRFLSPHGVDQRIARFNERIEVDGGEPAGLRRCVRADVQGHRFSQLVTNPLGFASPARAEDDADGVGIGRHAPGQVGLVSQEPGRKDDRNPQEGLGGLQLQHERRQRELHEAEVPWRRADLQNHAGDERAVQGECRHQLRRSLP